MRKKQKSKTGLYLLLFFGSIFSASAQKTFKYEAAIRKVDSTGFYKIGLAPEFVAKSNPGLSDIRLIDASGHFVPYITANNLPQPSQEKFVIFPEVSIKLKTDTGTTFVIENTENVPVNRLWLKLKNTAVTRTVNLSGSDDLNRWFAIKEDIPLEEAELNSDGTYLQSLSFPASNYHYLKLLVNDKNKVPVKFLQAGIYTGQSLAITYLPIPGATFVQKDSNKITYLTIRLNDRYLVNEIALTITAPKYFKRDVTVYKIDGQSRELVSDAELNSNQKNTLFINTKANALQLQINNGDNLPLSIKNVSLLQEDQFIVSYMEAGKTYKLLTGDNKVSAPDYDLKFFTDSIHGRLPEIGHEPVVKNSLYNIEPVKVKKEYTAVIWAAIVVALLLLGFLTVKMIGEVGKKAVE